MNKRYIGAIIYLIPVLLMLFLGGNILKYGLMICSLIAMWEVFHAFKHKGFSPVSYIAYAICIIYYIGIDYFYSDASYLLGLIIAVTVLGLIATVIEYEKYKTIDSIIGIFAFIYCGILLSFIFLISNKQYGQLWIWLIFILSWSCDVCAYYVGVNFGKKKIAPIVSPKKSLEGSIAGLIGAVICSTLFGFFLMKVGLISTVSIYNFVIIGVLGGVMTQFGDLTASALKRYVGIKDFGNIFPGHGGILDRFDSIIFATIVVYYYVSIFMGL